MTEVKYRRDIEDTGEQLEFDDPNPVDFWEKKQRELVTSVVDYNLGTLADLVRTKAIDLSPAYQRRFRWDEERQSRLIESFLMNVPVPPIFLNEDVYGQYSVIDGKQRLQAIYDFLRGRLVLKGLTVFSDINGLSFDDLPNRLQNVINTRPTLRSIIILRQSDQDVKFEVFQRLNTGGVRLNAQEIRNSAYTGSFNNLVLELSENRLFHRLLGIKVKEKSTIYQEMRDAELVLRYFTFRINWQEFSGGMKRNMDIYMAENRHMQDSQIQELRNEFIQTLESVAAAFGQNAYQRWLPEKEQWKQQVLASLYDAQMFACQDMEAVKLQSKQEAILENFKLLFTNAEFRRSIDAATNTPAFFRTRIHMIRDMLNRIVNQ